MIMSRAENLPHVRTALAVCAALLTAVACNRPPADAEGSTVAPAESPSGDATASDELPVMVELPAFALTDQGGNPFGTGDLTGRVWIANFVFTRCMATCPVQTARLAELQQRLQAHPRWGEIRLVSFSVDPGFDTPEVLTAYAQEAGADPAHWRFLTGPRDAIWELSKNGFKLAAGENPPTSAAPLFHSPKLVLVDRESRVRGYYDGMSTEGLDAVQRALDQVLDETEPVRATSPSSR